MVNLRQKEFALYLDWGNDLLWFILICGNFPGKLPCSIFVFGVAWSSLRFKTCVHNSGRGSVVIFCLSMAAKQRNFTTSLYFFLKILQKDRKNRVFLLLDAGIVICIQMR